MFPQLANMFSWWQWSILAAVPPAIVALYFLKLKRRPLEVPSTYLWHKSIEDLHVNTIWQRLRRNLLLFLQLLLVILAILALLRPSWSGKMLVGERFIFLVDNSASMQATDVEPSRLEEAKRRVGQLIDQMDSGDVAMIVSFADSARVEQMFTDNRRELRRSLAAIKPSQRTTSAAEAIKVASGLANPGRSADDVNDYQVAKARPAKVFVLSDGRFDPVVGFSLGNLEPVYMPIGEPGAANLGILAFSVRRHELNPQFLQAFARLENFGSSDVSVDVELLLDSPLVDAGGGWQLINTHQVDLAAGEARGIALDVGTVASAGLKLRLAASDHLALDNEAYATVNPPRRAKVLLVTPGNQPLRWGLETKAAQQIAELTIEPPEFLKEEKTYRQPAAAGAYDLVIYDRCQPQQMPQANTLFIGRLPPLTGWKAEPKVDLPQVIDTDPTHPLTEWIDLGNVILHQATPLVVPPGGSLLVDSDAGPLLAIAPREGFEDAVMGFLLIDEVLREGKPETLLETNWPTRPSFAVFILNVLYYLGGQRQALASGSTPPGRPVTLSGPAPRRAISVLTPSGKDIPLERVRPGKLTFTDTAELGVYEVLSAGKTRERFAVNLFDRQESSIAPSPTIEFGNVQLAGQTGWEDARREIWKWLLMAALVILLVEWYIYNRRVYL